MVIWEHPTCGRKIELAEYDIRIWPTCKFCPITSTLWMSPLVILSQHTYFGSRTHFINAMRNLSEIYGKSKCDTQAFESLAGKIYGWRK